MGMRGPEPQYDVLVKVHVTTAQAEFLDAMSELQSVSRAEVIRRMIDQMYPYTFVQYLDKEENK